MASEAISEVNSLVQSVDAYQDYINKSVVDIPVFEADRIFAPDASGVECADGALFSVEFVETPIPDPAKVYSVGSIRTNTRRGAVNKHRLELGERVIGERLRVMKQIDKRFNMVAVILALDGIHEPVIGEDNTRYYLPVHSSELATVLGRHYLLSVVERTA
jgi:hypothetical protein